MSTPGVGGPGQNVGGRTNSSLTKWESQCHEMLLLPNLSPSDYWRPTFFCPILEVGECWQDILRRQWKKIKLLQVFFFSPSSRERSEKPASAALKLLMKESERGICFNMLSQNGIFKEVWIKTSDTKKSVPNKRTYLSQSCWLASIADMWVLKQNTLQKFKKKRMNRKKKNDMQVVGNANNTNRKGSFLCRVKGLLHSSWEEW